MVYIIISSILVGGAVMFIGGVMQEQEQESLITKKVRMEQRQERVPVRDNGTVAAPQTQNSPATGKGGPPRALV